MHDPSKRFITMVLALGIVVLAVAIAMGERMGDRVLGAATEKRLSNISPVTITPAPNPTTAPYGPDWKRSQVLAAAPDPGFPDPRVPPVSIPTRPPAPSPGPDQQAAATPRARATPRPTPSPTPNLNLPIWRRTHPLPVPTAGASAPPGLLTPAPASGATARPEASPEP
ncbi:MAG: hypothetical protein M3M96_01825 [Candidatus Eremiobacteraeota bacterium]|nr:hypothetical protein [Candidatus Eremiobacteraeota bacterium]